ncbi:MAG TPA: O-antigen ligase family protein [Thermoleophilia bacterium]|nr:O-antigen ligase family protein [Thermoleophilia bacterium]
MISSSSSDAGAGRGATGPAPGDGRRGPAPGGRFSAADAALLGGGALLTALVAAASTRSPLAAAALLVAIALAAAVILGRRRLARASVGAVLTALLVSLPVLALLGPSFALPVFPQAFLFRLVLAVVIYAGVCYLFVRRDPMPFAAKDLALPAVLWFAWLLLGMIWAPDKLAALTYIAIVVTMAAVFLATAAAGGSRRRLIWFGYTMLAGYAFVVGFTILEARLGIRLPTSRLLTAVTSQTYAVTSVFHNQNDLATYIVLCWPFMLCAFFFTRRFKWLALTLLFMAMGAAAFVRTGSRSSLVAAGISSLAAVVLFWHLGPKLSSRAGKVVMGLVIVGLVVAAGWLLFNDSSNAMLRQFRLEALLSQAQSNQGSGAIRSNLTERGLEIAGGTWLLGAGPGQAEGIIGSGTDALGISNLHNWWLETYADGGLVGFSLHVVFFLLLVVALWPVARHDPDPLTRYLACGTWLALLGWTIGSVGPSSSVGFAPMWILYGLGLAVVSRSRLATMERETSLETGGPARPPGAPASIIAEAPGAPAKAASGGAGRAAAP